MYRKALPPSVDYRGWTVRHAPRGDQVAAMANPPRALTPRVAPIRLNAPTEVEAIVAAKAAIDGWHAARAEGRGVIGDVVVASAAEFRDALEMVAPNRAEWAMLEAHARAPGRALTSSGIAAAAGYPHFETANAVYGKLARRIGEQIGLTEPGTRRDGTPIWTNVIACDAGEPDAEGRFVWRMHAPLAEALAAMGRV